MKGVCFCGSIAPKITVWVHRGPLHDPFRRFQFGIMVYPPVSVPGYMRAQRRGDDCRRPRTTTRPPCPPGKAGCAPKAPPTAALLAKLLPRLTHGAPVQLIPQSAADRSSGRALRAARTRGHREAGQPGRTCQLPARSGLGAAARRVERSLTLLAVQYVAMSGFCARASALGGQVARLARSAIGGCSGRAERT